MPQLHLHREIKSLNKLVLQLGGQVEENLRQGIQFIQTRNTRQALDVKDEDQIVDSLEVQVEEECLKLLALYQPVASSSVGG
jgi:phosphate transport system protein